MEKAAVLAELARAGSHLLGRSPEATAAAEGAVRGAVGRLETGAKRLLNTPIPGTPELLPGKLTGPLRKGVDFAIENPETILGTATPIPGGGMLAHAGKRALERGLNSLAPAAKIAFSSSAYDAGPAPTWSHDRAAPSGASNLPAFKAPRLTAAVQKTAAGVDLSQFENFVKKKRRIELAKNVGLGAAGVLGAGLMLKKHLDKKKEAAGAPTRGGFMMASDIPAFQPPRLDQAVQKYSGFETEPYTSVFKGSDFEKQKSKGKEKDSDALPEGIAMQPWDNFKRSKYAMTTEKLAEFVEGLMKEAIPGLTPQSQLDQGRGVGAPTAKAPPGPSIADQAKPKGPGFGTGIAGANKGGIGGQSIGGIGRMSPIPQL
jgi:hypothetical protein